MAYIAVNRLDLRARVRRLRESVAVAAASGIGAGTVMELSRGFCATIPKPLRYYRLRMFSESERDPSGNLDRFGHRIARRAAGARAYITLCDPNAEHESLKTALLHPSSFILHPSSFILHPSSFILHPSSFAVRRLHRLGRLDQSVTTGILHLAVRIVEDIVVD